VGVVLALATTGVAQAAQPASAPSETVVWRLDSPSLVGGYATDVLGAPRPVEDAGVQGLLFNGKSDGVFVPLNPIAGFEQFTIEVLFKPDGTGDEEQRFLHVQDSNGARGLLETRLTKDRQWALDAFLSASSKMKRTLLDRSKLHPTDQWHWVAMVCDGTKVSSYVNGVKELEGPITFPPTGPGRISLGVRQNKVYWFKGIIAEVRVTPSALPAVSLQRVAK
jgi:hypothetical protein